MKKCLLLMVFATLMVGVSAQHYLSPSMQSKYHMLTWEELNNHRQGIRNSKEITPTAPPTGFVRNIAEWERNQGVIIAYPSGYYGGFGIPVDLIQQLADITHVYLIYTDAGNFSDIQDILADGNVNTDSVSYHNVPADTYWTRDYSPWFIQHGTPPEAGIVNFDYNRNRPNDNSVPVEFGNLLGIDVFGMEVEHTGGNYMCDGMGKAASTTLVYDENAESESYNIDATEVDARMESFLGITDYLVVDDPMGDYIEHIDCWGKFLDVDKVLVGEVPESDSRYEDYEAAANYFENHKSSYGTNYEVYRAYSPDDQPYTNSLIMNGHVFVPVPTGSGSEWNDEAIAVYEEAMPGYQIHAVENTTAPSWQSTDALHCRTHEVADVEMLHIFHHPLPGLQNPDEDYEISADIVSYGEHNLISDSLKVYYSVNGENWQEVLMNHDAGNTYKASIPAQNHDDTVEYIIHAADESGRSENHPFIGFPDPHAFVINEDSNIETGKTPVISCFPNPAKNNINIALHHFANEKARLIISHVNGKICREIQLENADDWTLLKIDVADLSSGAYIIQVMGEKNVAVGKFIRY
ncbi:MAG: agmatine deiminase family protein [Bacteroidota bacterium]|nr:agmatine deiminase family protein [Bacteroidota bacterium]